jgi:hypothetical protein
VKGADGLRQVIESVASVVEIDKVQLLYAMAESAGESYASYVQARRPDAEAVLIPYIELAHQASPLCQVAPGMEQRFVTILFNGLLGNAMSAAYERLDNITQNWPPAISAPWRTYVRTAGGKQPRPSSASGSRPSLWQKFAASLEPARLFLAIHHLDATLLFRQRIRPVARIWEKHKDLFTRHQAEIPKNDVQYSLPAYNFQVAYDSDNDLAVASAANEIEQLHFYKLTRQEAERVLLARQRLGIPAGQVDRPGGSPPVNPKAGSGSNNEPQQGATPEMHATHLPMVDPPGSRRSSQKQKGRPR